MIKQLMNAIKSRQADLIEGTNLDLELPLSDALVNQVLREQVEQIDEVELLEAHFEASNIARIRIKAKVPTGLFKLRLPEKTLRLRIDPPAGLPGQPVIRMHIMDGLSGLERSFLHLFDKLINKKFPEGVKLDDDLISVDLQTLLNKAGMGHLIAHVRRLSLDTEPGRIILRSQIEVEASA